MRWWQCGLVGAFALSTATAVKVVRAIIGGAAGGAERGELGGFAAAILGMGFLCGVVVWTGKGLYRRIGWLGDAIAGLMVMVVFFVCCMLLFEPELLGSKFYSGDHAIGPKRKMPGAWGRRPQGSRLREGGRQERGQALDTGLDVEDGLGRHAEG